METLSTCCHKNIQTISRTMQIHTTILIFEISFKHSKLIIPSFCRILCFFRLHCIFEGFVSLNRILENYWILTRGPWVPLLTLETLSPLNTQENFEPSLVEIGPVPGSEEEDFDKFDNVFLLFCYYLPLQKGMTLNSLEQS